MKPYEAREIAAKAWCDKSTSHLDMIPELSEAFAKILVEEVGKASPAITTEGTNMDKQYLSTEFDSFFEFPSDDKSQVSSISAKLFAEHIAYPIKAEVERLRDEIAALRQNNRELLDQRFDLMNKPTPPVTEDRWLPIETAPKDELILVGPTTQMGICVAMHHSRDGWVTETCSEWSTIYAPTHWLPLPKAPAMQEDKP